MDIIEKTLKAKAKLSSLSNEVASAEQRAAAVGARILKLKAEEETKIQDKKRAYEKAEKAEVRVNRLNKQESVLIKAIKQYGFDEYQAKTDFEKANNQTKKIQMNNAQLIKNAEAKARGIVEKANGESEVIKEKAEMEAEKLNDEANSNWKISDKSVQDNDEKLIVVKHQISVATALLDSLKITPEMKDDFKLFEKKLVEKREKLIETSQKEKNVLKNINKLIEKEKEAEEATKKALQLQRYESDIAQKKVAERLAWGRKKQQLIDFEAEMKQQAKTAGIQFPFNA